MASKTQRITIIVDRLKTYSDFIENLMLTINEFYIDDGSFSDEDDRKFHKWCFNKVCDGFKKEGIDFSDNTSLEEYFYEYNKTSHFNEEDKDPETHLKFWKTVFDVRNINNKHISNMLVGVYMLFDKSIDEGGVKKKNMEMVLQNK